MSNESSKDPESSRTQGTGQEDTQTAKQAGPASTWNPSRGDSPSKQPGAKSTGEQKSGQQKSGQPAGGKFENAKGSGPRTGTQREEEDREDPSDPHVDPVKSGSGGRSEGSDANRAKQSGNQPARPTQK